MQERCSDFSPCLQARYRFPFLHRWTQMDSIKVSRLKIWDSSEYRQKVAWNQNMNLLYLYSRILILFVGFCDEKRSVAEMLDSEMTTGNVTACSFWQDTGKMKTHFVLDWSHPFLSHWRCQPPELCHKFLHLSPGRKLDRDVIMTCWCCCINTEHLSETSLLWKRNGNDASQPHRPSRHRNIPTSEVNALFAADEKSLSCEQIDNSTALITKTISDSLPKPETAPSHQMIHFRWSDVIRCRLLSDESKTSLWRKSIDHLFSRALLCRHVSRKQKAKSHSRKVQFLWCFCFSLASSPLSKFFLQPKRKSHLKQDNQSDAHFSV